jgi:hypothetical protein
MGGGCEDLVKHHGNSPTPDAAVSGRTASRPWPPLRPSRQDIILKLNFIKKNAFYRFI